MGTTTTIEAEIREGQIHLAEPQKLPRSGRALVIILDEKGGKIDPKKIQPLLGWLKTDIDAVEWQRGIREEWDRRL